MSVGKVAGFALGKLPTAYFWMQPFSQYKKSIQDGDSKPVAAAKAATTGIAYSIAGKAMTGINLAQTVPMLMGAAGAIGRKNAGEQSKAYRANFGGYYQDTQGAYTMRQRGVQAMQQSGMNVRSVLGSEARMFHR